MPTRNAQARWTGTIKDGEGTMKMESGWEGTYSFATRFEQKPGTNPEELIGAAHAGCLSMAMSLGFTEAGYQPEFIETDANVTVEDVGNGPEITKIELSTHANIPGIDQEEFDKIAADSVANCPVSKALKSVGEINFEAHLVD
jgi:osmotically inducible protein OsmC